MGARRENDRGNRPLCDSWPLTKVPIIEQDVERIPRMKAEPDDLKRIGKDIERRVLTRAVRAHLEHRIITSGRRTIVFSR